MINPDLVPKTTSDVWRCDKRCLCLVSLSLSAYLPSIHTDFNPVLGIGEACADWRQPLDRIEGLVLEQNLKICT
jgi:hypothetical protein